MKSMFVCLAAMGIAAGTIAGDVYRNDFGTRTSAAPLTDGRWMAYTYEPGTALYRNYENGETVPTIPSASAK